MNRIDLTFKRLREEGKKAFIPYITAGDPDMATSKKAVKALVRSGADIIELGVPFSDPLADGPTIQRAVHRSLAAGFKVSGVFRMVKDLRREVDVPLVFMTYYNIVIKHGITRFIADATKAGVDGIIVPDLPLEEAHDLMRAARRRDFCVILLAAPTTPVERFKKIANASSGFIYYVSLTGVTGARKKLATGVKTHVRKLKRATDKPICVGFGVSNSSQAKEVASVADGVIVGSAVIGALEKGLPKRSAVPAEVEKFARSIAQVVHRA